MHPFCCVSTVPVDRQSPSPFPEFHEPMPTVRPESLPSAAARSSRDSSFSSAETNSNGHARLRAASLPAEPPLLAGDHRDVKLNGIVGSGIAGILQKWVNYGKGWRPRWFVLQDGVLSYYKIHGPDKIEVNEETEKGSKVIGEESMKRASRRHRNGQSHARRRPFGEIHLKVSSIRESRSDDKRFSIFTGTKRLHLRAETREDRAAWMEALQAVKDMFPRMSNSELMAPIESFIVSTETLRQRLQEEGLNEGAIQDCEQIMRNEFVVLQNQLMILKQKQSLLMDALRQLETEKVDLENTLVDESQRKFEEHGAASRAKNDKYSGMMQCRIVAHL